MTTICKHPEKCGTSDVECNHLYNKNACPLFTPYLLPGLEDCCFNAHTVAIVDTRLAERDARIAELEGECERLRGMIGVCEKHKTLNDVLDSTCEACDDEYLAEVRARAALAAGKG